MKERAGNNNNMDRKKGKDEGWTEGGKMRDMRLKNKYM